MRGGLHLDDPSRYLIRALVIAEGLTTAAGNAAGTTFVDVGLIGAVGLVGTMIVRNPGNPLTAEARIIRVFNAVTGQGEVDIPFNSQVAAATPYVILTDSWRSVFSSIISELRKGLPQLSETWQDELGIDLTVWSLTNPATGTAWSRGAAGAYLRATSVPNANETARLVSNQRWLVAPGVYGTNTVARKTILEFELRLTNVANLDNTLCIFGFTPGQADNRGTPNILAWILQADILASLSDSGGVETVNTGFGETLTNWNKLRIEVESGVARFYVNEGLVATHIINLPNAPMYENSFIGTEAGGAGTIEQGITRCWHEDRIP